MTKPKVLFYVQHLLGIGHLKRATTLARAMTAKGIEVTVVSGGESVPVVDDSGMSFVQLPAVKAADRTFSGLVGEDGAPISDQEKAVRRDFLLNLFNKLSPDVLIIELYPFGRRQLRFELLPLLDASRARDNRPVVVSSVRDILVEKKRPERDQEMVELARQYFDHVLVHGDPDLIPFDKTFARAKDIKDMLHYTGYVVEHEAIAASDGDQGTGEVIVSSGSGAVGELLLRAALRVRPQTDLADAPWRLLAGFSMAEDVFTDIQTQAPAGVVVERARPDFVTLLKNCRISISQGGYNTVMEVLATGAIGIAIPYAGGNETEQTLRARLLEERGLIRQMPEDRLTDEALVQMIEETQYREGQSAVKLDTHGASKTAELVAKWAGL